MRYNIDLIKQAGYEVLEDGSVISHKGRKPRTLKEGTLNTGHKVVNLRIQGRSVLHLVHRLVYIWFHGPIDDSMKVDHIDDNPANNALANLQLLTHAENIQKYQDSVKAGTYVSRGKTCHSKPNRERATTPEGSARLLAINKLANMKINACTT